ncbi:MAG: helix-turn-helix transcriptional regulator [Synergistaceae bacterium]|nr:helix-turn-helix transcriptional regulator [Synergistaceae bacterium]
MIGARIKSLREELRQSQEELAHSIGMHANTIARWERDELLPRGTSIAKLARSLNTTSSYLLEGEDVSSEVGQENMTKGQKSSMLRMKREHSLEENRGMVVYKANGQEIEIPATRDFYGLFEQIIEGMKSGVSKDETLSVIEQGQDGSINEKELVMA